MLKKVSKTCLITNLIYFTYHSLMGKQIYQSQDDVLEFLTFGLSNSGPLWYLLALLYTLAILSLIFHYGYARFIQYLPLLLFPTILLGRYAFVLGARGTILIDFNVLMTGLPYVSLGYCIHQYKHRLSTWNWELLCLLFLSLNIIETAALEAYTSAYSGRYFFTMPLSMSIFCLFLCNQSWGANTLYRACWTRLCRSYLLLPHTGYLPTTHPDRPTRLL